MDTDLVSCSKCGHAVKEGAEACAYCGTIVSSADPPLQSDEKVPGSTEQPAATPSAQAVGAAPALDATEDSADNPEISAEKRMAESSSQSQPAESQPSAGESAPEGASGPAGQASPSDEGIEFELPDDELVVEFEAGDAAAESTPVADGHTESAGLKKPDTPAGQDKTVEVAQQATESDAEVIPLSDKASVKAATDDSPDLPQAPVLEVSGEDPSESETLGADILELVEDEAPKPEAAPEQPSETTKSSDEPKVRKQADAAPAENPDNSGNADEELAAVLLTPEDKKQSAASAPSAKGGQDAPSGASEKPIELAVPTAEPTAKSDNSSAADGTQAKADLIQKQTKAQAALGATSVARAAQTSAEEPKPQKAAADAQLLKKQKAALAKAQALKKKKLKLAKVQALKRKKAALLKAQALKKQKDAQAGVEKTIKQAAAGSNSLQIANPNMNLQSMEANTKMLGLLKKYEGQAIGINYDNSADIKEAELVEANDEFFSVFVKDQELSYSHPLKTILTIIEGQDGVETGNSEQKAKYKAVIKVYPLVLF